MKCMTPLVIVGELSRAREAYLRKFGEGPPEYPEGARWGGCDELARLLRAAIGRNSPLRTSETGTRLLGLRAVYAARFGIEPIGYLVWYGNGERGLQHHMRLLERCLEENSRRLVLESADFEGFEEAFLDELGADEFEDVKLNAAGRPIPPVKPANAEENG